MALSTIFLYLIGVERMQESQELQNTTHLGKEFQDSKGANSCTFVFRKLVLYFFIFIYAAISFFIKAILFGDNFIYVFTKLISNI